MRQVAFTFPIPVTNAICATQTFTASNQAVLINGSLKSSGIPEASVGAGIQRTITIFCTGNISTSTFTITGFDLRGASLSTTLAGPAGAATATSPTSMSTTVTEFSRVTGVSFAVTASIPFTIGTGATGVTTWVENSMFKNPFAQTVAVITSTYAVTVQDTPDDVQATSSPNIFSHATIVAATSNQESNYAFPARYVRAIFSATTANPIAANAQVTFIQAG